MGPNWIDLDRSIHLAIGIRRALRKRPINICCIRSLSLSLSVHPSLCLYIPLL